MNPDEPGSVPPRDSPPAASVGTRLLRRGLSVLGRRHLAMVPRFEVSTPAIALTFDDGPHPVFTPRLLDLLESFRVRATFFVLGEAAAEHPHLITELARSGHVIGNHSWDHPRFPALSSRERRQQLRACHRATAPHGRRLFRPPWGKFDPASALDAFWLRYDVIGWNVDVGDWWDQDSERMADRLSRAGPGDIILLHDAVFTRPEGGGRPVSTERGPMLDALRLFLELHAHRFRFATIPEMFRLGRAASA